MKLRELHARLIRVKRWDRAHDAATANSLLDAQGLELDCPCGCGMQIHLWFDGIPLTPLFSGPGRWKPIGSSIDDLTFTPYEGHDKCSVQIGNHVHFFVRNGEAVPA